VTFTPSGRVVVITGGAGTLGKAIAAEAFARGARTVVICDVDGPAAAESAMHLNAGDAECIPFTLDVSDEDAFARAVEGIESRVGPVDLWCSNAGVKRGVGLGDAADWQSSLGVNVLGHVHMARHLVPRMLARGGGHVVVTSSAAGLLSSPESAPYAVTKHASVALAEWLSIVHGDEGLGVACVCPQAVGKPMNSDVPDALTQLAAGSLPAERVATDIFDALAVGRFLVLPHPEVADYERRRTTDRERWLAGMRRAVQRSRPKEQTTSQETSRVADH